MKNEELGCAWGGGLGYVKGYSTELKSNIANVKGQHCATQFFILNS